MVERTTLIDTEVADRLSIQFSLYGTRYFPFTKSYSRTLPVLGIGMSNPTWMLLTGITAYLKNSGRLEAAQHIANHESLWTTKLYDRRQDKILLDELERIAI